ncbi:hypothetical protein PHET_05379 [Paragonimus heterotremus]|uniref:Peptidase S54 rhomboid domain-containing protein n=1 Tax=Paragonimus heterotremus TaxID=100268 RepID=A0A8J4SPR0_9TREM|nr:hypothetical protein PHET_05379 [Paragonimus heterotremus]
MISGRMNNAEENDQSLTDEPTNFITVGTTQIPRLNIACPLLQPSNQNESPSNVPEKLVRSPRLTDIEYADDTVMLSSFVEDMQTMLYKVKHNLDEPFSAPPVTSVVRFADSRHMVSGLHRSLNSLIRTQHTTQDNRFFPSSASDQFRNKYFQFSQYSCDSYTDDRLDTIGRQPYLDDYSIKVPNTAPPSTTCFKDLFEHFHQLPAIAETIEQMPSTDDPFSMETRLSSGITHSDCLPAQPFFSHFSLWLCLVQVIIFFSALALFGTSPWGSNGKTRVLGRVPMPNLVVDYVCRLEYQSLLLSIRRPDLIRLGARFGPCMRSDPLVQREVIERQKALDRVSGCCIRNDGSGCFQTRRERCSPLLSTWSHHSATITDQAQSQVESVDFQRSSGSTEFTTTRRTNDSTTANVPRTGPVCGLDPAYCLQPHSSDRAAWPPDDITQWPICQVPRNRSTLVDLEPHMQCEVIGRPCCVGIRCECIITTREHCVFLRGIYNPRAALCSQVNCLEQSCGMWGFIDQRTPMQFYRALFSLFLHPNLLVLLLSLFLQLIHMRNFENVMDWWRVAIIFLLSGLLGSFMSVLLHPYQIGMGPSHMGTLIAQLIDFSIHRAVLKDEYFGTLFMSLSIICLFLLGLLPIVDNTANLASGIAGALLYPVVMSFDNCFVFRSVCLLVYLSLLTASIILMYTVPFEGCHWCRHLTCVPLVPGLCDLLHPGEDNQLDCISANW